MQGGNFDSGGYQNGLYGSLNYDAGTIKLHHSHFPESSENYYSGYNVPVSATGSYMPREPPSYAESTVYQTGFVPNPSSPYYKMPRTTLDISDYGQVRDSVLMKAEVTDSGLHDSGISPRFDGGESRMVPSVDVNIPANNLSDSENLKLENGVSEFKTDLSLHETLSPNASTECISSGTDIKELETLKPNDSVSDAERENADDDKARGNSEIKPALSYIALIAKAILESSQKRLSLGSIYSWIEKNYPFYLNKGQGWRNSVRHNLSLNDCFIKAGRCEDGKGNYWAIHPANIQDFMRGDFRQRRRSRRRGRKKECELGMYHMTNGYLGATSPLGTSPLGTAMPFTPTPALSTIYSPYTDAERRAYRLDDALLRQSMNNPFMKWYQSNSGYGPQQGGCNTGVYGNTSPQWQTGYTDQGSQGVYPINAFTSRCVYSNCNKLAYCFPTESLSTFSPVFPNVHCVHQHILYLHNFKVNSVAFLCQ